jgi:hypothetical protein
VAAARLVRRSTRDVHTTSPDAAESTKLIATLTVAQTWPASSVSQTAAPMP